MSRGIRFLSSVIALALVIAAGAAAMGTVGTARAACDRTTYAFAGQNSFGACSSARYRGVGGTAEAHFTERSAAGTNRGEGGQSLSNGRGSTTPAIAPVAPLPPHKTINLDELPRELVSPSG